MNLRVSKNTRMVVANDGPAVLLNLWTNQQVNLNFTASAVVQRFQLGMTLERSLDSVASFYSVSKRQLATDIAPVLDQLVKMKFLEACPE